MRPERLLRLFPPAWRKRYGEEFLATVGHGSLSLQQTVDVISSAIDAWLSADVRRATAVSRASPRGGGTMTLKSLMACERRQARYTTSDALIGAGMAIAATLVMMMAGSAARRAGWEGTGETLAALAFPVSWTLSMPFWLMKGQPWKAQVVIVGGTLAVLAGFGVLSSVT